jgi:hypothetical protein
VLPAVLIVVDALLDVPCLVATVELALELADVVAGHVR